MWQKLTPLEQKEFEETVKTGRIGHLVTVHTPWWEVRKFDNHSCHSYIVESFDAVLSYMALDEVYSLC